MAQPAANQSIIADIDRVGVLLRAGRNLDAVDLAKQVAAAAPPSERQFVYQWAGWVCRVTLDIDCARDILAAALPHLDALLRTPGTDRSTVSYNMLLIASHLVATGDYRTAAEFLTAGPHRRGGALPPRIRSCSRNCSCSPRDERGGFRISRHRATISTRHSSLPFP